MQSRNICFGVVALAFMSSAYPQALPGGPPPQPNMLPIVPLGNNAPRPNAPEPDEMTRNNPDPAMQRFNREFGQAKDSFVAPVMNMDIKGAGISLPTCVAESKDGKGC
jgi:hypothetical protein